MPRSRSSSSAVRRRWRTSSRWVLTSSSLSSRTFSTSRSCSSISGSPITSSSSPARAIHRRRSVAGRPDSLRNANVPDRQPSPAADSRRSSAACCDGSIRSASAAPALPPSRSSAGIGAHDRAVQRQRGGQHGGRTPRPLLDRDADHLEEDRKLPDERPRIGRVEVRAGPRARRPRRLRTPGRRRRSPGRSPGRAAPRRRARSRARAAASAADSATTSTRWAAARSATAVGGESAPTNRTSQPSASRKSATIRTPIECSSPSAQATSTRRSRRGAPPSRRSASRAIRLWVVAVARCSCATEISASSQRRPIS